MPFDVVLNMCNSKSIIVEVSSIKTDLTHEENHKSLSSSTGAFKLSASRTKQRRVTLKVMMMKSRYRVEESLSNRIC